MFLISSISLWIRTWHNSAQWSIMSQLHSCHVILVFIVLISCSFTCGLWYVPMVLGDEYIWYIIPAIMLDIVGAITLYVSAIIFDPMFVRTRLENSHKMFLYCICFCFYEIHKTGNILLGEYIWPLKNSWDQRTRRNFINHNTSCDLYF